MTIRIIVFLSLCIVSGNLIGMEKDEDSIEGVCKKKTILRDIQNMVEGHNVEGFEKLCSRLESSEDITRVMASIKTERNVAQLFLGSVINKQNKARLLRSKKETVLQQNLSYYKDVLNKYNVMLGLCKDKQWKYRLTARQENLNSLPAALTTNTNISFYVFLAGSEQASNENQGT